MGCCVACTAALLALLRCYDPHHSHIIITSTHVYNLAPQVPQMVIGYRHVGHKVRLDTGGQISYKLLNAGGKDEDEQGAAEGGAEEALLKELEAGLSIDDGAVPGKQGEAVQGMFGKVRGRLCAAWLTASCGRRVQSWARCGVGRRLRIIWRIGTWPT